MAPLTAQLRGGLFSETGCPVTTAMSGHRRAGAGLQRSARGPGRQAQRPSRLCIKEGSRAGRSGTQDGRERALPGPRGVQNPTHIFSEEGLLLLGVLGLLGLLHLQALNESCCLRPGKVGVEAEDGMRRPHLPHPSEGPEGWQEGRGGRLARPGGAWLCPLPAPPPHPGAVTGGCSCTEVLNSSRSTSSTSWPRQPPGYVTTDTPTTLPATSTCRVSWSER